MSRPSEPVIIGLLCLLLASALLTGFAIGLVVSTLI
jgi:hypothetical protein